MSQKVDDKLQQEQAQRYQERTSRHYAEIEALREELGRLRMGAEGLLRKWQARYETYNGIGRYNQASIVAECYAELNRALARAKGGTDEP